MVQNQLIQVESRFRPRALKFCSVDLMRSEGLGPVVITFRFKILLCELRWFQGLGPDNNKKNVPELGMLTANLTWLGRPCSWTLSTKLVANRHLADVYFSTPPLRFLLSFTLTKGAIAVCLARRPIFIVYSRLTWISILSCCSYASWTSERCMNIKIYKQSRGKCILWLFGRFVLEKYKFWKRAACGHKTRCNCNI